VTTKPFRPDVDAPKYEGKYAPYDIIKEGTIAIVVVGLLVVLLATLFGSPDERAITIKDLVQTPTPSTSRPPRSVSSTGRPSPPSTARPTTPRRPARTSAR